MSEPQKNPNEIIQELDKAYADKLNSLGEARDQQYKSQEKLIASLEATLKALQVSTATKEQFLINTINSLSQQNDKLNNQLKGKLPTVHEDKQVREDNL